MITKDDVPEDDDPWQVADKVSSGILPYSVIAERMKDPTYAQWYEENFGKEGCK